MKIHAARSGFLAACQSAAMAISPRDVKPVLRSLLVRAKGDDCEIQATDLEIGLTVRILGVTADEPGDALLPAEKLLRILRELPDDEIVIDADESGVEVIGQSADFEMPGDDSTSFPEMGADIEGKAVEILAGPLRTLLQRTSFAAASSEHSRFGATTGLMFECDGETLTVVATDGRRLALVSSKVNVGDKITNSPVIPAKASKMLLSLLDDEDESVAIRFGANEVLFKTSRITLSTRLVEGRFPAWRQVLPTGGTAKFTLPAKGFLSALRQAAIMTDDESKRVVMNFDGDKVSLKASGASSGKSLVSLPITGEGKLEISFDPKFLVDFLKVLPADGVVEAEFMNHQSAGLFRFGGDYRYVVVPLVGGGA